MKTYEYGNPDARLVLVQAVGEHDIGLVENTVEMIKVNTGKNLRMIAALAEDWNRDLSPWEAPAVFGNENFGDGARGTLKEIEKLCTDSSRKYLIGGYSLAGLFAIWTVYQTDIFSGVAAASPSIWFPGFTRYMMSHDIKCDAVYLSLGDRESKTKNKVMATVGDKIREGHEILKGQGVCTILEWNQGNHFKDADKRVAKAFSWLIEQLI